MEDLMQHHMPLRKLIMDEPAGRVSGASLELYIDQLSEHLDGRNVGQLHPAFRAKTVVRTFAKKNGMSGMEERLFALLTMAMLGAPAQASLHRIIRPLLLSPLKDGILFTLEHATDVRTPLLSETKYGSHTIHSFCTLARNLCDLVRFNDDIFVIEDVPTDADPIPLAAEEERACRDEFAKLLEEHFLRGLPIDPAGCTSAESLLLAQLSRIHDISGSNALILNEIIRDRGPHRLFRQLVKRMYTDLPEAHERLYIWAGTWRDGALLT